MVATTLIRSYIWVLLLFPQGKSESSTFFALLDQPAVANGRDERDDRFYIDECTLDGARCSCALPLMCLHQQLICMLINIRQKVLGLQVDP